MLEWVGVTSRSMAAENMNVDNRWLLLRHATAQTIRAFRLSTKKTCRHDVACCLSVVSMPRSSANRCAASSPASFAQNVHHTSEG
eukprot:3060480-Amphidinium_carterae.1